jgi:hypothetical protein
LARQHVATATGAGRAQLSGAHTWVVVQRKDAPLRHAEDADCVERVLVHAHKGDALARGRGLRRAAQGGGQAREQASLWRAGHHLRVEAQVLRGDVICQGAPKQPQSWLRPANAGAEGSQDVGARSLAPRAAATSRSASSDTAFTGARRRVHASRSRRSFNCASPAAGAGAMLSGLCALAQTFTPLAVARHRLLAAAADDTNTRVCATFCRQETAGEAGRMRKMMMWPAMTEPPAAPRLTVMS